MFAVFAYRYDAHLVEDLLRNIGGFIDGYVSWDDRQNQETWYHEGHIREHLLAEARAQGADWVLCIDPDERLEKNAGPAIRKLIRKKDKVVYGFKFPEMWSPSEYRVDGLWGQKIKYVLFPLLDGQTFMNLRVHSQWHPQNPEYRLQPLDLRLYHLKMIDPENRESRKRLYNYLDPHREIQSIGYDYLTDETELRLEKISGQREYLPPYNPNYQIRQMD